MCRRLGSFYSDYPIDARITMMQIDDTPKYLMNWNHQSDQRLLRDVVSTTHRLSELAIFSDQGLASIIENHPAEQISVTTMGDNPSYPSELQHGVFDDHDGRSWIDMVRRGRICLRLSNLAMCEGGVGEIIQRLCGEMMECQPGLHTDSHNGELWITSPYAIHYFGVDDMPTVLWQIRGHRRVHHYPNGAPFVPQRTLEQIVTRGLTRPLYFEPAFDDRATITEQVPGDVLGLPLHTPYRIETSGTLSLTLTTTYQTRETHRRIAILRSNDLLNRWLPSPNRSESLTGIKSFAKRTLARGIPAPKFPMPQASFRVCPHAANCVGPIDAEPQEPAIQPTIPLFPGLSIGSPTYASTGTEN